MAITATKAKAGKTYKVNENGAADASVKYQVILDAPLQIDKLPVSFTGVPTIGSEHPDCPGLYVQGYDVSQPEGAGKSTLEVTVKYGRGDIAIQTGEQGAPDVIFAVKEWGWDDGMGEKELVASVDPTDPKPVLNSAGDPFDSVPRVNAPTPTFTKVVCTSERMDGYSAFLCTTNSTALTIGDMTCPIATLLCTVAERKIIGASRLPYEYTIRLRYRSNVIGIGTGDETIEAGWDAAVVDAGMRELDATTGAKKLIQVISQETGQPATVTSPALLDGEGAALDTTDSGAEPVILRFQAYKRAEFPQWFYSEPETPEAPEDDENTPVVDNGGGASSQGSGASSQGSGE